MKIIALIQSRVTSERFPKKVLEKIGKKPLFEFLYDRLNKSKLINEIAFIIPKNNNNNLFIRKSKKEV